jgi:hypothetical protein
VVIRSDLLAFYYHRRRLEDLADWVVRVLLGDGSPQRDLEDITDIRDCLTELEEVERTVSVIRSKLRESGLAPA